MSIILDALKKLEQKKRRGSAPDLMAVHTSEADTPQNRKLWPLLITIILAVNVVMLLVFFHTFDKDEIVIQPTAEEIASNDKVADMKSSNDDIAELPQPTAEEIASNDKVADMKSSNDDIAELPQPTAEDKPAHSASEKVFPKENGIENNSDRVPDSQPAQVSKDQERPELLTSVTGTREFLPSDEELSVLRDKIKEERSVIPVAPEVDDDLPENSNSDSTASLLEFNQLSKDIQKELPSISINGHIYSDNRSSRMVNINGHLMREGEEIADGLKIDEITMSGIIFTYKDIRFRMRVF